MKTHQSSMFVILIIAFLFTACQKDGLVDMNLLSDKGAKVDNNELDYDSDSRRPASLGTKNVDFEIMQSVKLNRPECANGSSLEIDRNDELDGSIGCYGKYSLTSNNDRAWAEEYGSFTSHVALEYDPSSNEVTGTITLEMEDGSSAVVLKAMGAITRSAAPEGDITMIIGLQNIKGSGPSAWVNFHGDVLIMHADIAFDNTKEQNNATIMIRGNFESENRYEG